MNEVIKGFLERNLKQHRDNFIVDIVGGEEDCYTVKTENGKVFVKANNNITAINGIYDYLKKHCNLQLSWCGNKSIEIESLVMFDGTMDKRIEQKFRVYLNYCTLDYTMCWWNFERWEKEIDFMAMNGINMPLAPIGAEAVWFETLIELGFSEDEALSTISGPAFWAWQLMTNIEGYLPPKDKKYVYERLELGRKILNRYIEYGMKPIQQGFSGHVPALMKEKFPNAKILMQRGWCQYPKTAQLDPLDPLFNKFGKIYLSKLKSLFGFYGYIACDPFHEGTPPKNSKKYLSEVGSTINALYKEFDENSTWVIQAWTLRRNITLKLPKNRVLVLDLNSEKTKKNKNMWGFPVIAGMLHDFGGKNAMQGKLQKHSQNAYLKLKKNGANVVGAGIFSEAIEQNPVVYDLQFELLTISKNIELSTWLDNYVTRRYGKFNANLRTAWEILIKTCYRSDGYEENKVGSVVPSRPEMRPLLAGPGDKNTAFYDVKLFEKAVALFLSVSAEYKDSEGYQYDLCDLTRQALSNRFRDGQYDFADAYKIKSIEKSQKIAKEQLELLDDLNSLLSHRVETSLSKWINDSHALATDVEERKYFDLNARALITSWGDINGSTYNLYDYSWREWNGLIKEYYYKRWSFFYEHALTLLKQNKKFVIKSGNGYAKRKHYLSYEFGRELNKFELSWLRKYSEYEPPVNSDVIPTATEYINKYKIGK